MNTNDYTWHVSQLSDWFGMLNSQSIEKPFFAWTHPAVSRDENGCVPAAVILDGETLSIHPEVPRLLFFAAMGYANSNDLAFIEMPY